MTISSLALYGPSPHAFSVRISHTYQLHRAIVGLLGTFPTCSRMIAPHLCRHTRKYYALPYPAVIDFRRGSVSFCRTARILSHWAVTMLVRTGSIYPPHTILYIFFVLILTANRIVHNRCRNIETDRLLASQGVYGFSRSSYPNRCRRDQRDLLYSPFTLLGYGSVRSIQGPVQWIIEIFWSLPSGMTVLSSIAISQERSGEFIMASSALCDFILAIAANTSDRLFFNLQCHLAFFFARSAGDSFLTMARKSWLYFFGDPVKKPDPRQLRDDFLLLAAPVFIHRNIHAHFCDASYQAIWNALKRRGVRHRLGNFQAYSGRKFFLRCRCTLA